VKTGRWSYRLQGRSRAAPEVLWPLLAEAERWKEWSFLTRSHLVRPGRPDPDGVGAQRRLGVGPFGTVEEVVVAEAPRRFAYEGRRGLPVRSYRAEVVLEPDGSGTAITWSGELEPLVPGTGGIVAAGLRATVARFLRQLIRYADRQARAHGQGQEQADAAP
jgi:hypothetical protein